MQKDIYSTKDLAELVSKKLSGAKVNSPLPTLEILTALFENLFYASIKTEEAQFIKVTITLIDSETPDPSPPERIVKDRWTFVRFETPIPFTVKNIVKLSKAADPWSSSLAVDFDEKGHLFVWGLIDQAIHYQSFLNYEADEGPEQPGLFQTSINGLGSLIVIFDYELIATLKQNSLISNYLDVFRLGPVHTILKRHSDRYEKKLKTEFEREFDDEDPENWMHLLDGLWTQVISRILIRIQNFEHGGAILITAQTKDLDIKHKIEYNRLYRAIYNYSKYLLEYVYHSNSIHIDYLEHPDKTHLPVEMYLAENIAEFTRKESSDELKGAIRFVSSLSCIDGLVLLDTQLNVKGFGVVVQNINPPKFIYISKTANVNKSKLSKIPSDNFGTRHRSMFSYCWSNPGSLGFVVSQDGDIRAITTVNGRLVMWENIKVQRLFRSGKLNSKKRR